MGWMQKFWYFFMAALVVNVATVGYVQDKITAMFTSPAAEPLRDAGMCAVGAILLPPVVPVYGIYVFLPAISDVSIAIVLTLVIVTSLRLAGFKFGPWCTLSIGLFLWFLVKIFALALVYMAGDACLSFVFVEANQFMNPLAMMGTAISPLVLLKVILWKISVGKALG